MTAAERIVEGDLVDLGQFFTPVASDLIDSLIGEYKQTRARLEQFAEFYHKEQIGGLLDYFFRGNGGESYAYRVTASTFAIEGAISALNSTYWQKALSLTDVYEHMPQARRDEWQDSIQKMKTPEFTESTVRATLTDLLNSRAKFFSEKVDGIFRRLSRTHVTNRPEGFSKRFIMNNVLNQWGDPDYRAVGYINDLRTVVAKFMGREPPGLNASQKLLFVAKRSFGQWLDADGGAIRIRVYKKGTAHIEVHPELAWRLNLVLASLYPAAIPSQYRAKPPKTEKVCDLAFNLLPFSVLTILSELRPAREPANAFYYSAGSLIPKSVVDQACDVMVSIGGVLESASCVVFPYDPSKVLDHIVTTGCIPDQATHQFFPTPSNVGELAVDMAEIDDEHSCLEPSAGIGHLARYMPKDRTTCVEISELRCKVLQQQGYQTIQGDFLSFAKAATETRYDRIVMNPPYSEGRWRAHTLAAAGMLEVGGIMTVVLPPGYKNAIDLGEGWKIEWSRPFEKAFSGTSITVAIMKAIKLK